MNYIGSKRSLLENILLTLKKKGVKAPAGILDLFSGTGIVAQAFKEVGFSVVANDWQYYAYLLNYAVIALDAVPKFNGLVGRPQFVSASKKLRVTEIHLRSFRGNQKIKSKEPYAQVLTYLEQLPGAAGLFYEYYCEGGKAGRQYFSRENGLKIQAVQDQIEAWFLKGWITEAEHHWLSACLIESADRIANTASVYAAYLKHIKPSAQAPLRLIALMPIGKKSMKQRLDIQCVDSMDLVRAIDWRPITLTYIDPPYNARQYAANYHILESLARCDVAQFKPRGVTGLRPQSERHSVFCSKRHAYEAFCKLFRLIDSPYILFSYNNEGLLSDAEIVSALQQDDRFEVIQFKKIHYARFRSDQNSGNRQYRGDHTKEYLVLAKRVVR